MPTRPGARLTNGRSNLSRDKLAATSVDDAVRPAPGRMPGHHSGSRGRKGDRLYLGVMEFQVEAAQLINEGGVHCVPVVFARPLQGGRPVEIGPRTYLNDMPVLRLDNALAAERGQGIVAFVLED